mmetsp:Transcript_11060/g.26837  ORF Transcript_11060/g.26837 Transcript_11060/m.26837 type:complete len:238 (-) Transcript_11060:1708-2421(-)
MDTKLSSMMMTSDAFLATSVPWMPIENPTSAFLSAGASLVPSPVTATVCATPVIIDAWMPETRRCLSSGVERARTRSWGQMRSMASCFSSPFSSCTRSRKVLPSMTAPGGSSGVTIPHLRAMARAVWRLSPVTMRTTMPARWQSLIACGTSLRSGSSIPTRHTSVSPVSSSTGERLAPSLAETARRARQSVRSPASAKSEMAPSTVRRIAASIGTEVPSALTISTQRSATISAAPLV